MSGIYGLGSTTCQFKIKPLDFVCLALLTEFQSIKLQVIDRKMNNLEKSPIQTIEQIRQSYQIMESLINTSTQLIFGDGESDLPESISEFYHILRSNFQGLDQLCVHQRILSINHTLSFAFQGNINGLYDFINRLYALIAPFSLDINTDRAFEFQLESPLGLYIRRCRLHVSNLEFDAVSDLSKRLKSFCTIEGSKKSSRALKGVVTPSPGSQRHLIGLDTFGTNHFDGEEDGLDDITRSYLTFTDTYAPDYNQASIALRRFYDNRCSMKSILPGPSSLKEASIRGNINGLNHQQALLSLALFHYYSQAYSLANHELQEATRLARLAGDRKVLDQCTCLARRMAFFSGLNDSVTDSAARGHPTLSGPLHAQATLQSFRNLEEPLKNDKPNSRTTVGPASEWLYWDPNEEIFSAYKELSGAEPINRIYGKLFRALRMTTPNLEVSDLFERQFQPEKFDWVAWFGLQAKVWDLQGQTGLCELYEDMALNFDENNGLDSLPKLFTKSDIICQRAKRFAKNGHFTEALIVLLEEIQLDRSWHQSFQLLHHTAFEILELKAKHEDDEDTLQTIQALRVQYFDPDQSSNCVRKHIEDLYRSARKLMTSGNEDMALPLIASAITYSEKMNTKAIQATGITLWAESIISFEPGSAPRWILNKFDEQRIFDVPGFKSDLKSFGQALLIRARCLIFRSFSEGNNYQNHEGEKLSIREEDVNEILDLLMMIKILSEKIDDVRLKEKALGYRMVVIKEMIKTKEGLKLNYQDLQKELRTAINDWRSAKEGSNNDDGGGGDFEGKGSSRAGSGRIIESRNGQERLNELIGSVWRKFSELSSERYLS